MELLFVSRAIDICENPLIECGHNTTDTPYDTATFGLPEMNQKSFIHSSKNNDLVVGMSKVTARTPITTSNEKTEFTAPDENSLSCAVEAVGIASGKK